MRKGTTTKSPATSAKQKAVIDQLKTEPKKQASGRGKAAKPKAEPPPQPAETIRIGSCWKRGQYVYEVIDVDSETVTIRGGRTGNAFDCAIDKLLSGYTETTEEPTNLVKEVPAKKAQEPQPKAADVDARPHAKLPPEFLVVTTVPLNIATDKGMLTLPAKSRGWVATFQGYTWFAPEKKVGNEYLELVPIFDTEFEYRK